MKRFFFIVISSFVVAASHAQYVTDVYTATTNEVNDGLNQTKPVTPWGLKNWIGNGSSGGITNGQTNVTLTGSFTATGGNVVTNGQEEVHFGPVTIGQEQNTIGVDYVSDSSLGSGISMIDHSFYGQWNGGSLTNLQSTNLSGVLPMGTLTTLPVVTNGFLTTTNGTSRFYSRDAQYLTNVQDSALSTNVVVYSNSAVSLVSPLNVGSIAAIVVTTTNATSPSGNPSGTYVLSGVANGYFYWAKVGGGFYIWANSSEWNITASINSYSGGQWATTPRLNIPPSGTNWSARNGASGIINVAVSTNMLGAVFGGSAYAGGPVACVQSMTVLGSDTANGGYLVVRNSASPIGPRFILFNQASAQSVVDFYTIGGSQITDNPAFRIAAIDDGASSANLVFKSSINKGTINDLVKIYGASGRMELASTITATNGFIGSLYGGTPQTNAPTLSAIRAAGMNTNWGFDYWSNDIPSTKISAQYNAQSNLVYSPILVGNITLATPRWNDAPFQFFWASSGPTTPDVVTSAGGIASMGFSVAGIGTQKVYGTCQFGHDIAPSNSLSYIEPHNHVSPLLTVAPSAGSSNVAFTIIYDVTPIGAARYGPITNTVQIGLQAGKYNNLLEFSHLTNSVVYPGISGVVRGTFYRSAATSNEYNGTVILDGADVHYQVDRLGSATDNAP